MNQVTAASDVRAALSMLKQINSGKPKRVERKGKRLNATTIISPDREASLEKKLLSNKNSPKSHTPTTR